MVAGIYNYNSTFCLINPTGGGCHSLHTIDYTTLDYECFQRLTTIVLSVCRYLVSKGSYFGVMFW